MAAEVHQFTITVPPGTPITAPTTTPIGLPNYEVERLDLQVPAGPAGLMGFQISLNGQQWLPWETGQWLVWDKHDDSWPLVDQPNLGAWSVVAYNTGVYPHKIYVRLHVNPLTIAAATAAPSVNIITSGVAVPIPVSL